MAGRAPQEGVEQLAAKILNASGSAPHVVFSLDYGTSRDGFKARYRELAKALHPDKAKSKAAEEAFKGEREDGHGRRERRAKHCKTPLATNRRRRVRVTRLSST